MAAGSHSGSDGSASLASSSSSEDSTMGCFRVAAARFGFAVARAGGAAADGRADSISTDRLSMRPGQAPLLGYCGLQLASWHRILANSVPGGADFPGWCGNVQSM